MIRKCVIMMINNYIIWASRITSRCIPNLLWNLNPTLYWHPCIKVGSSITFLPYIIITCYLWCRSYKKNNKCLLWRDKLNLWKLIHIPIIKLLMRFKREKDRWKLYDSMLMFLLSIRVLIKWIGLMRIRHRILWNCSLIIILEVRGTQLTMYIKSHMKTPDLPYYPLPYVPPKNTNNQNCTNFSTT